MVKAFSGKRYELDVASQENVDAFLQALGVANAEMWKEILGQKIIIGVSVNGDHITYRMEEGGRKSETTCKLDEEFDEELFDSKTRSKYSVRGGNTVVHWQRLADGKEVIFETTFFPDKALETVTLGNVMMKKTFKAI